MFSHSNIDITSYNKSIRLDHDKNSVDIIGDGNRVGFFSKLDVKSVKIFPNKSIIMTKMKTHDFSRGMW